MIAVIIVAGFFVFIVSMGIRAQFRKRATGKEGLVGEVGEAKTKITVSGGTVFVHGEYWNAVSDETIKKGSSVKVMSSKDMIVKVKQA